MCQDLALIRSLLVALYGTVKLRRRLRHDRQVLILTEACDHSAHGFAVQTIAETVEHLHEDHLGGQQTLRREPLTDAHGLLMNLVPRIYKGHPVTGVSENPPHSPFFLVPYRY